MPREQRYATVHAPIVTVAMELHVMLQSFFVFKSESTQTTRVFSTGNLQSVRGLHVPDHVIPLSERCLE